MNNSKALASLSEYQLKIGLNDSGIRNIAKAAALAPKSKIIAEQFRRAVRRWIGLASATDMVGPNPFDAKPSIHIHPANICNAKCRFCAYSTSVEKRLLMDTGLFRDAVAQYTALGGSRMYLTPNNGDPLVNPNLAEMLAIARQAGIQYIGMTTNGILLSRGNIHLDLLRYSDNIGISLPGFDRQAYHRLFGVDRARQVLDGIERLARAKREIKSSAEILLILRIDRPMREVLADPGMERIVEFLQDGALVLDDDVLVEVDDWGGRIDPAKLTGIMRLAKPLGKRKQHLCRRLISDIAILPDGSVRVCACRYLDTNLDELVIGNLRETSLENILLGSRHRKVLYDALVYCPSNGFTMSNLLQNLICLAMPHDDLGFSLPSRLYSYCRDTTLDGHWPLVCQTCNWHTTIARS